MRDIDLWRMLETSAVSDVGPAALASVLVELPNRTLEQRAAFFGRLDGALSHSDPAVRKAAVACLGGAGGIGAFRRLIAALDDPVREVQFAAIDALRQSAVHDASRLAHALFHSSPAVRLYAAKALPSKIAWQRLLLLDDPDAECAHDALSQIGRLSVPAKALPIVLDFISRGVLSKPDAQALVAGAPLSGLAEWMEGSVARTEAQRAEIFRLANDVCSSERSAPVYAACGVDAFDDLVELFWLQDEAPGGPVASFFEGLAAPLLAATPEICDRAIASMLVASARHCLWPKAAANLCAMVKPAFLGYSAVPLSVRRLAAQTLHDARLTAKLPDDDIGQLLRSDIAKRDDGDWDLAVVAGVLRLSMSASPISLMLTHLPVEEAARSFAANSDESLPLLWLGDDSVEGGQRLCAALSGVLGARSTLLLAADLLRQKPRWAIPLETLSAAEALALFGELARIGRRHGKTMPSARSVMIGKNLAERLDAEAWPAFFALWLADEEPRTLRLAHEILSAGTRGDSADEIAKAVIEAPAASIASILSLIDACDGLPYGLERHIADQLHDHPVREVRDWASLRRPAQPSDEAIANLPVDLSEAESQRISECSDDELAGVLSHCGARLRLGVSAALARRAIVAAPNVIACAALLGSDDPPAEVIREFGRFSTPDEAFEQKLDEVVVTNLEGRRELSFLACLWLYRWPKHGEAFATRFDSAARLIDWLRESLAWPPLLARRGWQAAAAMIDEWRYQKAGFLAAFLDGAAGESLLSFLTETLTSKEVIHRLVGGSAAKMVVALQNCMAPAAMTNCRKAVIDHWHQLSAEAQDVLRPWLGPLAPAGPPIEWSDVLPDRPLDAAEDEFRALLSRFEAGEGRVLSDLLSAARRDTNIEWFQSDDWRRLIDAGAELRALSLGLATSPHIHAYRPAVSHLLGLAAPQAAATDVFAETLRIPGPDEGAVDEDAMVAVRAFLECGTERDESLRHAAAQWLRLRGDFTGFPLVVEAAVRDDRFTNTLLPGVPETLAEEAVASALIAGKVVSELRVFRWTRAPGLSPSCEERVCQRVLMDAEKSVVRRAVGRRLPRLGRRGKMLRVAEAFAWGVRLGRRLTWRLFSIDLLAGDELGFTRLDEDRIHVSALPILRDVLHGREIVEGLIVHELGHHLFHRGPEGRETWRKAEEQGLARLLNLVADEHLERKIRASEEALGDRLKRLGAYAFHHSTKEISVDRLIASLGGRTARVLIASRLSPARAPGCVAVENGQILLELEKSGQSFSRFFRALRLGLGNRHNDPLVAEGLALFKGGFRNRSMPELLEIARRLREIFGNQTSLLDGLSSDHSLSGDQGELDISGQGITNEELHDEIQRINSPRRRSAGDGEGGGGAGRAINVSPSESFDTIATVVPLAYDPEAHRRFASEVARDAARMRRYLTRLGISLRAERRRVSGKTLDRARIKDAVLRRDPRMLIARKPEYSADLFLGVVIDCSGSMASGENIEKAKLFGALLAEAARGLAGIDVRLFGFTDHVIYDAGDARRPAVHALTTGGGNNDAGGLWHAAQAALASRRRAKLLVMISDGLPTECSVAALRSLVNRLSTRHNICCAQVAVAPLSEVCFPHYVLLDTKDRAASVRKFGETVARLVKRRCGASAALRRW